MKKFLIGAAAAAAVLGLAGTASASTSPVHHTRLTPASTVTPVTSPVRLSSLPTTAGPDTHSPEYPKPSGLTADTINCQGSTWYWVDKDNQLDHWYSGGGYFTDPLSGHQPICYVWRELNYPYYYQMMIVGGPANGMCVEEVPGLGIGVDVTDAPCVYHQANESWVQHTDNSWTNQSISANYCLTGLFPSGSGGWSNLVSCDGDPEQNLTIYSG